MFWALLAGPPGLAVGGGCGCTSQPPGEPGTHRQLFQPQPCGMEIALAKITARQNREPAKTESPPKPRARQNQEPASAKHQLGARNSPGLATLRCLGTNFPARGTPSIAAWPCHGQGESGKSWVLALIQQWLVGGGCIPMFFPRKPSIPSRGTAPPHILSPSRAAQCAEPLGWFGCAAVQRVSAGRPCLVPLLSSAGDSTASQDRSPR